MLTTSRYEAALETTRICGMLRLPWLTRCEGTFCGINDHLLILREQIAEVLAPLGLRFSQAKTRIVHISEGFDFLGFHIQWKPKRGTNTWYVYSFIANRPFRSVKAKIRALTPRTSQQDLRAVLIRINQITRGWANYFKHAIAKRTFSQLQHYTRWRIVRMMRTRHRWRWKDVRRWLTDPTGRRRGNQIPNPSWVQAA